MKLVEMMAKQLEQQSNTTHSTINNNKNDALTAIEEKKAIAIRARKQSNAMSIAISPGKQIAMNSFMLYMSGKQLNVFSISITTMAIMSPIKGIMNVTNAFRSCEDPDGKLDLTPQKVLFVLMNLVWLGVGLYKMANMNLLPLTSADWERYVVWKQVLETSSIPP
jgi:hypothetical protein